MKLSTHPHSIFKQKLSKEDKPLIMRQCVKHFDRHIVDTLEDVFELVSRNVVYAPIHWKRNHRKITNAYLTKIDLIVYDSDDGDTSDELIEMLSEVETLIVQTSGWTEAKEKYRIFIPLEKPITFESPEEYTAFYRWLGNIIGLNFDTSTTECGRGYIGLQDKRGFIIQGERLDPKEAWEIEKFNFEKKQKRQQLRNYIKSLTQREMLENSGYSIPTPYELCYQDKRFKDLSMECSSGNNYKAVFKLLGYCKFRGLNSSEAADTVMLLNLGSEYSNKKELCKRFDKLQ